MSEIKYETPFTPERIVVRDIKLNVPIYQRLFVWRTGQIRKLLSDLFQACDHAAKAYNIGVISVWANSDKKRVWDIVDGQQRLTFLSLFAAWAVSHLPKDSKSADAWRKFLFVDVEKKDMRIRFVGRPEDEIAIAAFGDRKIQKKGSFRVFETTADEFLKGKEPELERFADFVYLCCSFLIDALPEGYGPHELNLHFERMNSTGRQLEPIDIVKGLYFSDKELSEKWNRIFRTNGMKANKEKISIASILSANDSDEEDENDVNAMGIDDAKGETERLVADETLLLHSLRLASGIDGVSLDKSRILETFDSYMNKPKPDGTGSVVSKDVIVALENYSDWMDKHIVRIEKDERGGGNKFVFVSDKASETDDSENINGEAYDSTGMSRRKLKQLESMFYVSADDNQSWILEVYRRSPVDIQDDALCKILKEVDKSRHMLPVDDSAWRYPFIDRYWFWKLDYLLWELHEDHKYEDPFSSLRKEDHDAISQYVFRRDRSIEHLHPQNPPPSGEGNDWQEDREKHGDAARNGFGNLAMISSSFNSSQSNDSISTKMGRVDDQVREKRLQSIKLLLMVRFVQSNPQGWTVEAARIHESEMLKLLGVSTAGIQ